MTDDIKQKIEDYLKDHKWLNLGTVDSEGKPMVHTMAYVADGTTVYFGTSKETHKADDMMNNPNVAYTVDEDDVDVMTITGVQMQGKATLVTDPSEMEKFGMLMIEKFPFMKDMPQTPDSVVFRVDPVEGYYLDYSKGFTHRDMVTY
ncbi:general stress protein 26 [Methanohalophilus levihalophilus]|uniref:pyridoxamine 5'-phosphate oxidase family protein n=1 Tax=Methanohalophilus levihalophilus TaxID=1431282 RepID=UPI001AE97AF8|nr:pyridoxamine 5'-phosphate oxidase family protein [Methanohalophilus levihalophilus]MBP2029484.1 general stress protein 26 [Methanohalophilus levihalophilus]